MQLGMIGLGRMGANMDDLISRLTSPRAVWVMVPDGDPTEATVEALTQR